MKYSIIYKSSTGNTKLLAQQITAAWGTDNCHYFGEPIDADINGIDILAIGFWTDKGTCSEDLQSFLKQLHHQQIVLFGTAGFGGSQEYFDRILERVASLIPEDNNIILRYMCQGSMPSGVRERYLAALTEDPNNVKMQEMIDNFDQASSHPDEHDLSKFQESLKEIGKQKV